MRDVLAIIYAGGEAETLLTLSRVRAKASVPIAGNYRLIDFALSNCAHSGINHVAVLTQYLPLSLKAHIGVGRPWDLDRREGGVRLLEPYSAGGEHRWYAGTADALAENLEVIDDAHFDHVLVLPGEHVYKMDYRPLLDFHRVAHADITLVIKGFPPEKARPYGAVQLGRGNVVLGFDPQAARPLSPYASLGIYVFDRRFLVGQLREAQARGAPDIVSGLVAPRVADASVYAYLYYDYWATIDTVDDYYDVTFELSQEGAPLLLDDPVWPVFTTQRDDPPVKVGPAAVVENSLVANGSIINGRVVDSVLFRRVYVEAGAVVAGAVLMDGTRVAPGATVERAIVDKQVRVESGARLGADVGEPAANADFPAQLSRGISLVGKGAVIPAAFTVGRNCLIDIDANARVFARFAEGRMPNGTSAVMPIKH